ncbi:MAG: TspO/MBR family protein [Gammaproteobacteria bacterium]|nr:TspO/MBR family protein [Gammaproteobacteria bacterium]
MRSLSDLTRRDGIALAGFLLLCLAVSGVGGAITATSVDTWYPALNKPWFNPPDWIFAPVWTLLYIMMAVAGWRVWRTPASPGRRNALLLFLVQLTLNLSWSLLFFGYQQIGMALVEIVTLLAAIAANTLVFWRLDRLAGALFVPYVAWVTYAALLNLSLWILN